MPGSSFRAERRPPPVSRGDLMNHLFLALSALVLAVPLAGCQSQGVSSSDTLKIGAYSVVHEVIHDGLIPAFAARWKSKTGREVQFEESYSASGAQARAITTGFDADLAILSHEGDMEVLVQEWGCSTLTRRPREARAGTSTQSTGRPCWPRLRPGRDRPTFPPCVTSCLASRPM